ncbi:MULTISPECIES: alpha/beta hydrolase [unclassified Acinetobacter]|uniref:alpha/beta hydrolase n=1 Tax=unclassified Acinetobacter TaxID=196816 RepID=UPI002577FD96|nr:MULTISPECIES: alpha/beta hydrolase [unclassified Acinetobacter]MDM1763600.1 alpha/beta hydrolase [Acinetobacter sp. 226-1]MDM1767079.1 alpha/beta hydrolase [Acinetobacter sp. 226-4]
MFNRNFHVKPKVVLKKIQSIKAFYTDFRLYDLASITINKLTPKKGYQFHANIAYGLKARQRLDLYISNRTQEKPLIVFVHGGAWSHGDKSAYKFVGEAFSRYGYDVAVLNYHLAPQHKFPTYVDDLAVALNFLEQQQNKLGISTHNIALMGHSAGAFNITSLLYNPKRFQSEVKKNIKAIVGVAGPYHFDYKGDPLASDAFDQDIPYQQVMPYYFIEKNEIRHFLFTAAHDQIVEESNSLDLKAQLEALGNHCQMTVIPKTGHVSIMGSVSSLFSRFYQTRSEIVKALDQTFKNN